MLNTKIIMCSIILTKINSKTITLISDVLPDGTIRSLPDHKECITVIYANSGNNHLEFVPCVPFGTEKITDDMLFIYDDTNNMIKSMPDDLCWTVNQMKLTMSLKPCRPKIRSMDSKQVFHVMKTTNGTDFGAFVPGGQFAGMCVGHELKDEMFRGGLKTVGIFDCTMAGFSLRSLR